MREIFHWWPAILSWLGALLSLLTFGRSIWVNIKESKAKTSRFYLESFKEYLEKIMFYLKSEQPARRMGWVTAANISEQCRNIQKQITTDSDKAILEIVLQDYTHSILLFFSKIPYGQYFYGIDHAPTLDDAAKKSRPGQMKATSSLSPNLKNYTIDESQIAYVLKLIDPILQKNDGYSMFDSCGKISLNVLNFNNEIFSGLHQYLEHRRKNELPM